MPGSGWYNSKTATVANMKPAVEFHNPLKFGAPHDVYVFDDFICSTGVINSQVPQTWVQTETGTSTGHVPWVLVTTGACGTVTGAAGAAAAGAQELAHKNVMWKPSTLGTLYMEVRGNFVGTTTAALGDHFIGWSDVVTATSGLAYVISATSTASSTGLTEGAMLGYSAIPTSGALHPTTGNNYYGVFSTKATTAATPAAATPATKKDSNYHLYRVEIDTAGNCFFYLDGVGAGYAAAGVTATTALTSYVSVIGTDASSGKANTGILDYILVGASRA